MRDGEAMRFSTKMRLSQMSLLLPTSIHLLSVLSDTLSAVTGLVALA